MNYIDQKERVWIKGGEKINEEYFIYIVFPFMFDSMYPSPILSNDDYIYCSCVKCGRFIKEGVLCIRFYNGTFGVRLSCCDSKGNIKIEDPLIVYVHEMIFPLIESGCESIQNQCMVCDKLKCKNKDCEEILKGKLLYKNETEELMEHFYKIKLDLLSLFVKDQPCFICQNKQTTKVCNTCKSFVYCSKKCKKKGHTCKPFEEMWRTF
jgi:hypothetical protein